MSNTLGNAARSSGLSFVGSVISAAAGFVLSIVVARQLGPSGSGIVFQMISIFTIAGAVAKLGLDTTAVWLLPRLASDGRNDIRRAVGIILLGSLLGGLVTGGVVWGIAPLLDGGGEDLVGITRIAAVFVPFSAVVVVALAITRGLGGIRDYVLIGSIGLPVGRLAVVSIALAFAASAVVASAAWLGVLVVVLLLALVAAHRAMRGYQRADGDSLSRITLARRIGAYSAPRTVSSVIEQSLMWLDVLIVGLIAGPAASGVYGVVSRLVQAGTIPSTSMRIVVAPQFSRMIHQERIDELSEFYTRTAQWIVLMSMPIYAVLVVFADSVLRIFGDGFEAGALALMVMCAGAVVSAATGNIQSLLLMSGRSGWAAINKVIVLAVSLVLLLSLVPVWGIMGAALASMMSVTLDAILATVQVRRGVRVRIGFGPVLIAAGVAGASAGLPALGMRLLIGEPVTALGVGLPVAVLGWGAAMFLMRRRFALDEMGALLSRKRGRTPS